MNNAFIIPMAFPDTVVRVSSERFVSYLRFIGVGRKNYVRAGHAALVLIDKSTGVLEYFDFGRYITPEPKGRVRGKETDFELQFPIKAKIENDKIVNIEAVLKFLATNPKLTHGEGRLIASVCSEVNYKQAKTYISKLQNDYLIGYSAFLKNTTNCARFVTDTLIKGVTNSIIAKKLKKSQWFTPSTIGNVILADTEERLYSVSNKGEISFYEGKKMAENMACFFDKLPDFKPNLKGNLEPSNINGLSKNAQWLSGIGSGAWFECLGVVNEDFRFRRLSAYGDVDMDGVFVLVNGDFNVNQPFEFLYQSHCSFIKLKQNGEEIDFVYNQSYSEFNSEQKEHLA